MHQQTVCRMQHHSLTSLTSCSEFRRTSPVHLTSFSVKLKQTLHTRWSLCFMVTSKHRSTLSPTTVELLSLTIQYISMKTGEHGTLKGFTTTCVWLTGGPHDNTPGHSSPCSCFTTGVIFCHQSLWLRQFHKLLPRHNFTPRDYVIRHLLSCEMMNKYQILYIWFSFCFFVHVKRVNWPL